ncbi:Hypothetical protein, putative [Bodo saltans]|uniref:Uncharacterized protein n=1 Tax=Bodo saltans TaxID=75058 RepID=A0A0S4KL16_BODSA|nr:Hypothetical protein, putative [Bodo saltans]|eukprot:CUI15302.1 Hypothetical protein, putative [Bodo saltans]
MNVPVFVSARRAEIDRFLPLLFTTGPLAVPTEDDDAERSTAGDAAGILRRRGRAIHRRPASANIPLSRATREFTASLPGAVVRKRAPLIKFGRSRNHWARKIRLSSSALSTKKRLQLNVLKKRARRVHRNGRSTVKRRALRRRIRLAVGVRLGRTRHPKTLRRRRSDRNTTVGRVLVLPSHRWLARRFSMRTEPRCCGPWRNSDATMKSNPSRPKCVEGCDQQCQPPPQRSNTAVTERDHLSRLFTQCSLAIGQKRSMKQFRKILAATTEPAGKKGRSSWKQNGITKRTAPPGAGVVVDMSDMYVFRITLEAQLGRSAADLSAQLPSALANLFGSKLISFDDDIHSQSSFQKPGSALRGALRSEAVNGAVEIRQVLLCHARTTSRTASHGEITEPQAVVHYFLVPSAESTTMSESMTHALQVVLQTLSSNDVVSLTATVGAAVTSFRATISQTTLWAPARISAVVAATTTAADGTHHLAYNRTGVLSVITPRDSVEVAREFVQMQSARLIGLSSLHRIHPTAQVEIDVSCSYLNETSAVTQQPSQCGFSRVLIFVNAFASSLGTNTAGQQRPSVSPTISKQPYGAMRRPPRAPRVDAEETSREVAFRATRELHRLFLTAKLQSTPRGSFIAAARQEEQFLYEQHGVAVNAHTGDIIATAPTIRRPLLSQVVIGNEHQTFSLAAGKLCRFAALRAATIQNDEGGSSSVRQGSCGNKLRLQTGDLVFRVTFTAEAALHDEMTAATNRNKRSRGQEKSPSNGVRLGAIPLNAPTTVLIAVVARPATPSLLINGQRIAIAHVRRSDDNHHQLSGAATEIVKAELEDEENTKLRSNPPPLHLLVACSAQHARNIGIVASASSTKRFEGMTESSRLSSVGTMQQQRSSRGRQQHSSACSPPLTVDTFCDSSVWTPVEFA